MNKKTKVDLLIQIDLVVSNIEKDLYDSKMLEKIKAWLQQIFIAQRFCTNCHIFRDSCTFSKIDNTIELCENCAAHYQLKVEDFLKVE